MCGRESEFIRIRSPNSEPPVLRFEGSTQTTPNFLLGNAFKNLCDNSSISDDLPAPPVPVMPKIFGASNVAGTTKNVALFCEKNFLNFF